jgi:iron complex transport system ATP-binding protein
MALQADDMLIMAAGKVTHFGTTSDVITHRALEHVFENRIAIKHMENMLVSLPKM